MLEIVDTTSIALQDGFDTRIRLPHGKYWQELKEEAVFKNAA